MPDRSSTRPPWRRRHTRRGPPKRKLPTPLTPPRESPENDIPKVKRGTGGGSEGHPPANVPGSETAYSVRKAADLARQIEKHHEAIPGLRFRWVRGGESVDVRFVTDNVVTLLVHSFVPDGHGGKLNLQCLGDSCSLCLSGDRPEESCLLLIYFLEDRDLGVLKFKNSNYPGSLGTQLLPLLGREEYLNLVVDIQRTGNSYRATIAAIIDPDDPKQLGMDFGDDVLEERFTSRWPSPEEIVALVERRSNQQLLLDLPWLKDKLRRRQIDPTAL